MGWAQVALAAALLTTGLAGGFPAGAAESAPAVGYGMDLGSVDALAREGARPQYGTFWVGAWNANNLAAINASIKAAVAKGVTPAIHWYYWGDDVSPQCVENGCASGLHGGTKTKAQWFALARDLAASLNAHLGGTSALVIIETEFNKQGIDGPGYAATFDGYLKDQVEIFHAVPGVKTVIPFGNWNPAGWTRFPASTSATDYLGFQALRGSTRDSEATYLAVGDQAVSATTTMNNLFGKPIVLVDLGLSSYPEPYWADLQARALAGVFAKMPDLREHGLVALLYRSLHDHPTMDPANYFGVAERWWGLVRADGSPKPAFQTWLTGVGATPPPPPPAKPIPTTIEAEHFATKTVGGAFSESMASGGKHWNLWSNGYVSDWIEAATAGDYTFEVVARGSPAANVWPKMILTVGGVKRAEWDVASPDYQAYRATFPLSEGTRAEVRITYTNDAYINGQDRNLFLDVLRVTAGLPPPPPPPPPGREVPGALEAESFATRTTGGAFSDGSASGGKHWNLWTNGYVQEDIQSTRTGDHVFEIVARGSIAAGAWPKMVLTVDGVKRAEWDVASKSYLAYKATVPLVEGTRATVRIAFTNDFAANGEDRNLVLDVLRVVGPPGPPPPPNVPPNASFSFSIAGRTLSVDSSPSTDENGDTLTSAWEFGDGATGSGTKATRTYAAPGAYTVKLTVADGRGGTGTASATVTIANRDPNASIATTAKGRTVTFDASASTDPDGDALAYAWDLGGGLVATGAETTHRYPAPGVYPVRLRVADPHGGTATRDANVTVTNAPPTPAWTHSASFLAVSVDARASADPDGDALTYAWDWGDGTTSAGATATKTYAKAGSYAITLTVSDGLLAQTLTRTLTLAAPTYTPPVLEAERFQTKTVGAEFKDGSASGGALWLLWSNGHVRNEIVVPETGSYGIAVTARGNLVAGQWSRMEVRLDGALLQTITVDSTSWKTYRLTTTIAKDQARSVSIHFTNDVWVSATEDRNLWVDRVAIARVASHTLEAESCPTRTVGGAFPASSASAGSFWNLWTNGHVESAFVVPAAWTYRIEVQARGTPAGEKWPHMVVTIDGQKVAEFDVVTQTWLAYPVTRDLSAGTHTVRVAYTNDATVGKEDRNLHLDVIRIVPA